ncbi:NUDIX domain-containing protein [Xylanimonas ulmi]|uniref:8-oxo-dGTP pyrophosphatase MutT (NUDIX family) n=1 Tax=Xylanimonas ulmi TaxID=228973 RepID=A0A4Q7LZX8_9MICO|nr:NUDIX hydrolase [Xylanibacterium ulmi]RZS60594.1 8-oxo-dGTP pyrophosphatase MutT (NUDIX family) [Xylanibacterium ulmi]
MAWRTRSSRTAYSNQWIRVREDEVVMPDGRDGLYGVVEMRHPAVFVVALDDADRVLLVDVDRYTVGRSLEVVAGGSDGEPALVAAQRELREEAGLEADEWVRVGAMNALNGVCVAPEVVFVARGLRTARDAALAMSQAEEGIEQVRWVPFGTALAMMASGEITDGETMAALALALAGGHVGVS